MYEIQETLVSQGLLPPPSEQHPSILVSYALGCMPVKYQQLVNHIIMSEDVPFPSLEELSNMLLKEETEAAKLESVRNVQLASTHSSTCKTSVNIIISLSPQ